MKIQNVTDASFRKYGKVLEGYDFSALLKEMKHTPVPDDVVYVPSVEELEALDVAKALQNKGFGGIPIEIGYCNGHNKKLNAVEYHRSSEINVAVTDLVLLIGSHSVKPSTTPNTMIFRNSIKLLIFTPMLYILNIACGLLVFIVMKTRSFGHPPYVNRFKKMLL